MGRIVQTRSTTTITYSYAITILPFYTNIKIRMVKPDNLWIKLLAITNGYKDILRIGRKTLHL